MLHTRVEAADLIMVKAITDNLEGLHNETEAKDPNMVNASFKVITIREVHLNKIVSSLEPSCKVTSCNVLFGVLIANLFNNVFLSAVSYISNLSTIPKGVRAEPLLIWFT